MASPKLLLFVIASAILFINVSAHCCGYNNQGQCSDGTGATPCCGVGKCNAFCCACHGGCRAAPNPPPSCDCQTEYNNCVDSAIEFCDPEDVLQCSAERQACYEARVVCFDNCGITDYYNSTLHTLPLPSVFDSAYQSVPLDIFNIIAVSAEWTTQNGHAYNLLPTNNPTAATTPFWNSANSYNYPKPFTITFDLLSDRTVSSFVYKTPGDTTHDPKNFDLIASDLNGNHIKTYSFVGAAGTNQMQIFRFPEPVTARVWTFSISTTYSIYQVYVSYVNFGVEPEGLDVFSIVSVSSEWTAQNGHVTHLLPVNNPNRNRSPFWNSAVAMNNYPKPVWVVFDLASAKNVYGVQYVSFGDTIHDPKDFDIQFSSSPTGPFVTAKSFIGAAGVYTTQDFFFDTPVVARYWKFNIVSVYKKTATEYQAWVPYFNFLVL